MSTTPHSLIAPPLLNDRYCTTVSVVVAEILPEVALISVVPTVAADAKPIVETDATAVFDEVQLTELVTSRVVPSLKVPVAENCWVRVPPRLTDGFNGLIFKAVRGESTMLTVVEPEAAPDVAETVADPALRAVPKPVEFTSSVATDDVVQTASDNTFVLPSL